MKIFVHPDVANDNQNPDVANLKQILAGKKDVTIISDFNSDARYNRNWWDSWPHDCEIKNPKNSTIGALATLTMLGDDIAMRADLKGEIQQLGALIVHAKIPGEDARLLMTAHSDGDDYYLTWDQELIAKGSAVTGLKPQVMTPTDFVITGIIK